MQLYIAILLVSGLCCGCLGESVFLGGGATGDDGNAFVDGTPYTAKLTPHLQCSRTDSTTTILDMEFTVQESDTEFHYEGGPLDDEDVRYDTCHFLNTTEYEDDGSRVPAEPTIDCSLTRLGMSTSGSTNDTSSRTFYSSIQVDTGTLPATSDCGGLLIDTTYYHIIRCQRDSGTDKKFDGIFLMGCNYTEPGQVIVRTLDTSVETGEVPIITVDRQNEVIFNIFKTTAVAVEGPTETAIWGPNVIIGPLYLGQGIYGEVCLSIADSERKYFDPDNGTAPLGMYLTNCVAEMLSAPGTSVTSATFVDSDGCGTGSPFASSLADTVWATKFVGSDNDPNTDLDYLISPTCFRTPNWEATSFVGLKVGDTTSARVSCDVTYCTYFPDPKCFGDGKLGGFTDGYPTCPMARKRRADDIEIPDEILAKLPRTVTATYEVINELPPDIDMTVSDETLKCEETDNSPFAFILQIVTGVFLVVVISLSVCVILKSRVSMISYGSIGSDVDSGYDVYGYQNKAFN